MSTDRKKLAVARVKCDDSLMFFTRFFFKELKGYKFLTNMHHETINEALTSIDNYEYELLNINIPPRCSKTELVLNKIAQCLGKNPSANFLYISASDELRAETSSRIRDIVTSDKFRMMYDVELKKDQNSKNLWRTTKGGGLKTATIFGQVTGFGAGQMTDDLKELIDYVRNFEGAIVLDDINKTDDAESLSANNKKVVRVLFNTVMSRKNSSDTPIINIQQRSGLEDATAVLLDFYKSTGSLDKVLNVVIPAISNEGGSIWEKQLPIETLKRLRDSPLTSRMFKTQYMQEPVPQEGGIVHREWIETVQNSSMRKIEIWIDGAYTKNTRNDPTGLMITDFCNGELVVLDFTEKWLELPDLVDFIPEYMQINNINSRVPIYIEPKASGLDLKNTIKRKLKNPIIEISQKNGSKYVLVSKEERLISASDYIKSGKMKIKKGNWNKSFVDYLCNFPNDIHDEACDLVSYSIEKNLIDRRPVGISYPQGIY